MEIFVDTAIISEIEELVTWGVVGGVTTNPSLIAKTGENLSEVISKIAQIVSGPVSAEVIATDCAGMIKEAERLNLLGTNIVIKIPATAEGLKAVNILANKGIKTNVTLVFNLAQALLAAKAGATYVSPFVGRLDDIGEDGVQVVKEILQTFSLYHIKTKVIAASIRNLQHINLLAQVGVDIATIPAKLIKEMIEHELTAKGIERFLQDYKNSCVRVDAN